MSSKQNNWKFWAVAGTLIGGIYLSSDRDKPTSEYPAYEAVEMPADAEETFPDFGDSSWEGRESFVPPTALPLDPIPGYRATAPLVPHGGYQYYAGPPSDVDEEKPSPRYFDEREAKRQAEQKLARRGYDYSFGCTIDCSGHEAGWQYRAENRYPTYGSLDYGKSQSFAEGAQAYERALKKEVERAKQDFEFGNDQYASSYPNF